MTRPPERSGGERCLRTTLGWAHLFGHPGCPLGTYAAHLLARRWPPVSSARRREMQRTLRRDLGLAPSVPWVGPDDEPVTTIADVVLAARKRGPSWAWR